MKQQPAFELRDVSKKLGDTLALDAVSLCVNPGETVGIVGPNGAGKTTLFRLILGLLKPDSGSISLLDGSPSCPSSRKRVGFCFDGDGLYRGLNAHENLEFFRHAYEVEVPLDSLMGLLGVSEFGVKSVSKFSRGMRKRLALTRSLLCSPDLLLLDEPLLGLDPDGQHELVEVLRATSPNRTVLVSSHDLNSTESFCDRIVVLNHRILFDGSLQSFLTKGSSMYSAYQCVLGSA
ncbi:ATP-binding cassette domain-containing protein [Luteococcus sp. OSA5]|uniref:ATP-binding cassette domain-containing protein n=1 Tax=Luteococcus sp. OSA5 TaxID=3401630 RepID=UPI003B42CFF8